MTETTPQTNIQHKRKLKCNTSCNVKRWHFANYHFMVMQRKYK